AAPKQETAKAESSSASQSVQKEMTVTATAYTANDGGISGITATGVNLNKNPNAKVIAVDPNVIPLGSKVYVEGYGEAIAADTGGAIKGNKIDVHVPSKSQAKNWGVKSVKVKVLN
ncbi:3D domain-containing protein, partial [Bacillus safensis]